ncbi:MAG: tRNA-intron lyase, partial [Haloarculaceae archaeon]
MDATRSDGAVRAGPAAREQFYDARGYGQPREGDLVLAPVEAAHLLFRGDLATVDGMGFEAFLASGAVLPVTFQVYKDLRDRGFYLSPVGDEPGQVAAAAAPEVATGGPVELEFVVYPRGKGPWDDDVAFWVRAASERANVPAADLVALASTAGGADTSGRGGPAGGDEEGDGDGDGDPQSVLAVVDEEGELTYLGLSRHRPTGATDHDLPTGVEATLLSDRVLVPNPPAALHDRAFYGQRLDREGAALLLSLVEGAFLAESGVLAVEGGAAALRERGRRVEGDRFDRRQAVYGALRTSGVVPKTGFKF